MITFETKRHIEIDESYQGITLTEFHIKVDEQIDNDKVVDTFIRTRHFTYDCLRDCVKANPEKKYLGQAFNIEHIEIADFRKTNREGASKFLLGFLNEPVWGDDRNDFAKLLDKYFEIHNTLDDGDFYMISKDWFDKDDKKLIVSWVYLYYFLIISVNNNSTVLTLSEWTYD